MKKIIFIIAVLLHANAYSQAGNFGSWSFKTNKCKANRILPHHESTTVFDTSQSPNPKFIIDFFGTFPTSAGRYKVVKGAPQAKDEVSAGVGFLNSGALTFYSTTGGSGHETVTVSISNGIVTMSGTGIDMANQKDAKDRAPLTFTISRKQ